MVGVATLFFIEQVAGVRGERSSDDTRLPLQIFWVKPFATLKDSLRRPIDNRID